MTNNKALEAKIEDLENRLKAVESKLASTGRDPLYDDAKRLVIKHNKASLLFLQRKLIIDFERAAKILDDLEAEGVITPSTGIGPREVIIKNK